VLAEKRDSLTKFARAEAKATVFLLASPAAALRMYWKTNPAARSGGTDEEAMKRGLDEMNMVLTVYNTEKHADKRYGLADLAGIQTYIDLFRDEGVIPRSLPAKELVTNDLVDAVNDFDLAKVRALARDWK
jgi:NitT/TauT family transport system substrate-binding protein